VHAGGGPITTDREATLYTIVLLTEEALGPDDATYLRGLHEGQDLTYHVLVPADTERRLLVSIVDGLAVGDLRERLPENEGDETPPDEARAEASVALESTTRVLRDTGAEVTGRITADDPVPELRETVRAVGAQEVNVVTRPHVLEESFHRDWAHRARKDLGVPVLHVYAHTHGWTA